MCGTAKLGIRSETKMEKPKALSGKKKLLFYSIYYSLITLLIFSLAEAAARVMGHKPWTITKSEIVVGPGGRFYQTHPTLGYTHLPGHFKVILAGTYSFEVTNLDNTLRVTRSLSNYPARSEKGIWIFGDSVTYGWSVNDRDTYPWLLQEKFPNYDVVNFPSCVTRHLFMRSKKATTGMKSVMRRVMRLRRQSSKRFQTCVELTGLNWWLRL